MDTFALIIFGITSNLAKIKLIPALYDLVEARLLPENITIIGIARSPKTKTEFHEYLHDVLATENRHHQHAIDPTVESQLISKCHYLDGQLDTSDVYFKLKHFLNESSKQGTNCDNRMFYLATLPTLYQTIFENLKSSGLNDTKCGWVRTLIEKPIGSDYQSSKEINELLCSHYREDQIFRLDHYLGKETMQNILAFRFANGLFEPLINREHIDHIQITAAEDFGVGDRGGYYDTVGALKDVGQNHLLQMLTFATMDQPKSWTNAAITDKRIDLLNHIAAIPDSVVFGQYENYNYESNVADTSQTDTFFAFKTLLKSDRLMDVPVYFRGGKKLAQTVTEVSIVFKTPPDRIFKEHPLGMEPNALIYRIQPNEGIVLKVLTKKSGHELDVEQTYMQYCYRDYTTILPDPYLRLILDAFKGDQTFFVDAPEVEAQWKITDQLSAQNRIPIIYKQGSWGPPEADELIEADGRHWLEPSLAFCSI